MKLSPQLISELQDILQGEYGLNLSLDETRNIGEKLVNFFRVLAESENKNEYKNYVENKRNPNN